ncbi:MAG: hypothetical protein H8E71_05855 [Candidatus Marinimicrobia bacterium]|nr:hypothetical protein [Candidatus Neomarinimicrobiota bacterium]
MMDKKGCQCNMKFKCNKTDFDGVQHPAVAQINKIEKQTEIINLDCNFVPILISRVMPRDYSRHKYKIPPNTSNPLLI